MTLGTIWWWRLSRTCRTRKAPEDLHRLSTAGGHGGCSHGNEASVANPSIQPLHTRLVVSLFLGRKNAGPATAWNVASVQREPCLPPLIIMGQIFRGIVSRLSRAWFGGERRENYQKLFDILPVLIDEKSCEWKVKS